MDMQLVQDIFSIVGAIIVLISLLGLVFFLGYLAIKFTMVQNDKEIDYIESRNEEEKKIILSYKQAKCVRFKDLLKKGGVKNEDK